MNKYDELRKKNSQAILANLNQSLDRDVKKGVDNSVREIKEKINKLPWDLSQKIISTKDFISGTIAGKNVEFAFNESGEMSTRIDGSVSSFNAVNNLRKKLTSNNELIATLHSYLEEEDEEKEEEGKEEKKDALDEADDFLSKIDLSELSKDAKLELIESIIDDIQNSVDKDEFDDIMNEIYDMLDNYYVDKDEEKEETPEEEIEDDVPEEEEEPVEGEETTPEPVKQV